MKCDDCPIPKQYDYGENAEICSLFGWDNDDEHFKMYADGSDGCVHRKSTLEKWWKRQLESCPHF